MRMRLLLDECVDWRLLRNLGQYDVKTVRQLGWEQVKNGALLRLAEALTKSSGQSQQAGAVRA